MRTTSPAVPTRHDRHERGWRSLLVLLACGSLGFLAVSGAVIWLLPFNRATQMTVLFHTLGGLAATVPIAWYCVRHWRTYWPHPLTYHKLLGYLSLAVLALCTISGLVVTWQPIFGIRIDYTWRAIHRWTMVAVAIFGAAHVLALLLRDRARLGATARALADRGVSVTAIESDGAAARFAATHLPQESRSVSGRVEDVMPQFLPADVVILNPPRGGVDARVTDALQEAQSTRRVLYMSCDSATLARDVSRLPAWRITSLRAYDMFPQTAHVEVVCELTPEDA